MPSPNDRPAEQGPVDLLILQPAIRPERSGVTDHSHALAAALAKHGKTVAHVDIADPSGRRAALAIEARAVLLQLSIYGYAARGVPSWLPPFIADYRRRHRGRPWLSYCHELWVFRPPILRSAFWVQGLQRRICGSVIDQSDVAFLNSAWAYGIARRRIGDRALFMPTASNVGEPDDVPPIGERSPSLVVFGAAASRQRCYADADGLAAFMSRAGLQHIVDIGEPLVEAPDLPSNVTFEMMGRMTGPEVARQLLSARFGLFETVWGMASKSGVFAAYQAHGVVPVSIHARPDPRYQGSPGPEEGTDFLTLAGAAPDAPSRGATMHARYARYGLGALANAVVERARL